MAASRATKDYRLLIGDDWVPGSAGSYEVVNPATETVIDRAPEASAADADAAAQAPVTPCRHGSKPGPRIAPTSSRPSPTRSENVTTTCSH
jgi:hypothetical protein